MSCFIYRVQTVDGRGPYGDDAVADIFMVPIMEHPEPGEDGLPLPKSEHLFGFPTWDAAVRWLTASVWGVQFWAHLPDANRRLWMLEVSQLYAMSENQCMFRRSDVLRKVEVTFDPSETEPSTKPIRQAAAREARQAAAAACSSVYL